MARGLTEGTPHREASEQDMVHRFVPTAELLAWIREGVVVDAQTLAAWALVQARG